MNNKICGVYCIENLVNNKKYIGQSVDIKRRWRTHRYELNHASHINAHLQNAWTLYGEENFTFYILKECASELLDKVESEYICLFNTCSEDCGYNLDMVTSKSKIVSEETRKKLSDALSGENNPRYGAVVDDETRRKISEAHNNLYASGYKSKLIGVPKTEEHRKNLSIARMGLKSPKRKHVYCFELDEFFDCSGDVEDKYGFNSRSVRKCCTGDIKSCGTHPVTGEKLHWVYAENLQTIQND